MNLVSLQQFITSHTLDILLTNRTNYPKCKVCDKLLTYDIPAVALYNKWCSPICSNKDNDKKTFNLANIFESFWCSTCNAM